MGADGVLVYSPDPVQCFAEAYYEQRQRFSLERGASLLFLDLLSGGRTARGERWAFSRYTSRNEIWRDGAPWWIDALRLDPADGLLTGDGRLGRFNGLATVVWAGPALEADARGVVDAVQRSPVGKRSDLIFSASPLPGGAVLRVAGESTEAVIRFLRPFLQPAGELLGDDPWIRKW